MDKITALKLSAKGSYAIVESSDLQRREHPETYDKAPPEMAYTVHSSDRVLIQQPVTVYDPNYGHVNTGQFTTIELSPTDLRAIVAKLDSLYKVELKKVVKDDLDYLPF